MKVTVMSDVRTTHPFTQGVENVRVNEVCDQNGGRLSKYDKSIHIGSIQLKRFFFVKYEKYGTLSIFFHSKDRNGILKLSQL